VKVRGAGVLLACCLLGTASLNAEPAGAARPVKGALYVDYDAQAKLRVSKSGRRLSPRTKIWAQRPGCAIPPVSLDRHRRPVRIAARGRFRFVERTAGFVLRVRGRFATRDRVRIIYRSCGGGPTRLTAHRTGPIRFRNCRTQRAKTLLRTAKGRVFQQLVWRPGRSGAGGNSWIDAAYGCLFSVNEPFALGQDDDDDFDLSSFRLVAPYVAYEEQACAGLGCGFSVAVRDLRDGSKLREAPDPSTDNFGPVTDLELTDNGSVAWIANSPPFGPAPLRSVWASDSLGTRRLDNGLDIALGSLELNGSALSWVNGGLSRSATLE
jgi:hypothetical protein